MGVDNVPLNPALAPPMLEPIQPSSAAGVQFHPSVEADDEEGEMSPSREDTGSSSTGIKFGRIVSDLGRRLAGRTDRETLVNNNIIKGGDEANRVAPSIMAAKLALEKEKDKDKLAGKLQRRPSKTELKEKNILRENCEIDSVIQNTQHELEFEIRKKELKSILKQRPAKSELEDKNILKHGETSIDPSLLAATEKLKRAQLEDSLARKIESRPTIEELQERRILVFNETVEILPTWRGTEYNRRPDSQATFRRLTPKLKMEIREELNSYKRFEMPVHEGSIHNTAFH